jgi:hypothetical protein
MFAHRWRTPRGASPRQRWVVFAHPTEVDELERAWVTSSLLVGSTRDQGPELRDREPERLFFCRLCPGTPGARPLAGVGRRAEADHRLARRRDGRGVQRTSMTPIMPRSSWSRMWQW